MLTTVAYQLSKDGKKGDVVYALEGSVAYAGLGNSMMQCILIITLPYGRISDSVASR